MNNSKIVFANQYAGPLFRELAEDIVKEYGPAILLTGHVNEIDSELDPRLKVVPCPDQKTTSGINRILSWLKYLLFVFPHLLQKSRLLFIVSNPPVLPWLGYFVHILTRQRYVVLIYDLYPEMLTRFTGVKENGIVAGIWRKLNRISFEHADAVITIGDYMARLAEKSFNPSKTKIGKSIVIPTWADTTKIRPLIKEENWFATKYDQAKKLTVLYAGTLGLKHNVSAMMKACVNMASESTVHFFFIGRGAGYKQIEAIIEENHLSNTTLLPFQEEKVLPYSLTIGDVAVIAIDRGGEGVYVPGKTPYSLAAGSALLVLSASNNEITDWVREFQCGLVVDPEDEGAFIQAVERFRDDPDFLRSCKRNARMAAIENFDRNVCTRQFVDLLKILEI